MLNKITSNLLLDPLGISLKVKQAHSRWIPPTLWYRRLTWPLLWVEWSVPNLKSNKLNLSFSPYWIAVYLTTYSFRQMMAASQR